MSDMVINAWSHSKVRDVYLDREQTTYRGKVKHAVAETLGGLRPVKEAFLFRRYLKTGKHHKPIPFSTVVAAATLFVVSTIGLAISVLS